MAFSSSGTTGWFSFQYAEEGGRGDIKAWGTYTVLNTFTVSLVNYSHVALFRPERAIKLKKINL